MFKLNYSGTGENTRAGKSTRSASGGGSTADTYRSIHPFTARDSKELSFTVNETFVVLRMRRDQVAPPIPVSLLLLWSSDLCALPMLGASASTNTPSLLFVVVEGKESQDRGARSSNNLLYLRST